MTLWRRLTLWRQSSRRLEVLSIPLQSVHLHSESLHFEGLEMDSMDQSIKLIELHTFIYDLFKNSLLSQFPPLWIVCCCFADQISWGIKRTVCFVSVTDFSHRLRSFLGKLQEEVWPSPRARPLRAHAGLPQGHCGGSRESQRHAQLPEVSYNASFDWRLHFLLKFLFVFALWACVMYLLAVPYGEKRLNSNIPSVMTATMPPPPSQFWEYGSLYAPM